MDRLRLLSQARHPRYAVMAASAALTIAAMPPQHRAALAVDDSVRAMHQFLARPRLAHQYCASRRLEASGSGHRAWLDVQTDFALASGLQYSVTAEGGSGYIRTRVLRSLLEEEQRLIARGRASTVAISTDNYQFTPDGLDEHGFAVVRLRPLRKDRSLIVGRMFLTGDGDLLRVEGQLARNPSFWVTRATVVREYRRINEVLMPVSLETTAQLRLLGSAALRTTYRYSRVDDRAVQDLEHTQN
jgi:hypothetical protein